MNQLDPRSVEQLRTAVEAGDVSAAMELVRRRGYETVDQALGDLWSLEHDIGVLAVVIDTVIDGLRPYVQPERDTQL